MLGVDIFTEIRFDSWALQTLVPCVLRTRGGAGTFGKRTLRRHQPKSLARSITIVTMGPIWHAVEIEIAASPGHQIKSEEVCMSYIEP